VLIAMQMVAVVLVAALLIAGIERYATAIGQPFRAIICLLVIVAACALLMQVAGLLPGSPTVRFR
jgi:predicted membrane protein